MLFRAGPIRDLPLSDWWPRLRTSAILIGLLMLAPLIARATGVGFRLGCL